MGTMFSTNGRFKIFRSHRKKKQSEIANRNGHWWTDDNIEMDLIGIGVGQGLLVGFRKHTKDPSGPGMCREYYDRLSDCKLVNTLTTERLLSANKDLFQYFNLQVPCILYIGQTYRYSTDRHHASYIQDRRTYTPQISTVHPIYRTDVPSSTDRHHESCIQDRRTVLHRQTP